MEKIVFAIFTFLSGYWVKKFFDNRDLRRKILEPVFFEFESQVIYLQHEWRAKQKENINNKNIEAYTDEYNSARSELLRLNNELVYACKKIREEILINLTDEAFKTLIRAISSYGFFIAQRDHTPPSERGDLIVSLNEANTRFDETLPKAMEMVYDRYWVLISSVIVSRWVFEISKYCKKVVKSSRGRTKG
jgi:hypothetical protein